MPRPLSGLMIEAGGSGGGNGRRRLQLAVDFATMANAPSLHLLKADRGFIPAFCHGREIMEVFQQTPIPAEGKDHAFPCAFGISHISFFNDAHKPSSGELPPKITTLSRLNSLLLDTGRRDLSNGAVGTGYFSESCLSPSSSDVGAYRDTPPSDLEDRGGRDRRGEVTRTPILFRPRERDLYP